MAKVDANGTLPRVPKPVATPTMFCSAMKHSVNRSGNLLKNFSEKVEFLVSPSMATMRGSASPRRTQRGAEGLARGDHFAQLVSDAADKPAGASFFGRGQLIGGGNGVRRCRIWRWAGVRQWPGRPPLWTAVCRASRPCPGERKRPRPSASWPGSPAAACPGPRRPAPRAISSMSWPSISSVRQPKASKRLRIDVEVMAKARWPGFGPAG